MAASPRYKVYDVKGCYQASCHEIEAAGILAQFYGDGATIRAGHSRSATVWTEGVDGYATDSYDDLSATVELREHELAHPPTLPLETPSGE